MYPRLASVCLLLIARSKIFPGLNDHANGYGSRMEHAREREKKIDVAHGSTLPSFDDLGTSDASSIRLVTTYWDTSELRLLRWGRTLRHRRASDGSEDGWTVKLGKGALGTSEVLDREEIHVPGPPCCRHVRPAI